MALISGKIFVWRPAAWLAVSGADAFDFLQGQFTNDLRGLLDRQPSVYGLWLNQKGRVLADSFVLRARGPQEFWVGSYFSRASVIRERLESYVIADDVAVVDETDLWFGTTFFGPGSAEQALQAGGEFVFPGRRGLGESVESMTRTPVGPHWPSRPGDEVTEARIEARIPSVPVDIGPGELPNEGGLELDAISYTKGCYLGQEVMARLKTLGQVRRRLLRVEGTGPLPALPCPLFQGDRRLGELRSASGNAVKFTGLALLSLLHLRREAPLRLSTDGPDLIQVVDSL